MKANRCILGILSTVLLQSAFPPCSAAQSGVEENVVYGMHSGLALLMDVHHPAEPIGYGIVVIAGSGWSSGLGFDAPQLKTSVNRRLMQVDALLDAGFTLFSINHRTAPRFRYPAAVEDAQRAVRFIRHNADRFGIDRNRLGALGTSSGGHLASMLGVLDGHGDDGPDPVNRESSKVQAVVTFFASSDFTARMRDPGGLPVIAFLGTLLGRDSDPESPEARLYREASTITHVSPDDPPFLLIHGDADTVAPINQSEMLRAQLLNNGVDVELIRINGGGHGGQLLEGSNASDYFGPLVAWFDRHLRD